MACVAQAEIYEDWNAGGGAAAKASVAEWSDTRSSCPLYDDAHFPSAIATAASANEDVSAWDVAGVKDFAEAFKTKVDFNGNLNDWDMSGATSMESMLHDATKFNGNVEAWDVSSAITLVNTFRDATKFNGNLAAWDTVAVSDASLMFSGASSLDTCNKARAHTTAVGRR